MAQPYQDTVALPTSAITAVENHVDQGEDGNDEDPRRSPPHEAIVPVFVDEHDGSYELEARSQ
jgi:hypothetical protein